MMRLLVVILVVLLSGGPAPAAAPSPERSVAAWLAEIDRAVWRPFTAGVKADDEQRYLAVRSRDYLRVQADASFIMDHDQYVDDTKRMMRDYRDRGTRVTLEVRFEERIVNGAAASERGVMRVIMESRDGPPKTFYSTFHSLLRKESGVWKVLTDYAPPGGDVGEARFLAASPPGDYSRFRCYMPYPEKKLRCDPPSAPQQ